MNATDLWVQDTPSVVPSVLNRLLPCFWVGNRMVLKMAIHGIHCSAVRISYCMSHRGCSETDSDSTSRQIGRLLWNANVSKSAPPVPVMSQVNAVSYIYIYIYICCTQTFFSFLNAALRSARFASSFRTIIFMHFSRLRTISSRIIFSRNNTWRLIQIFSLAYVIVSSTKFINLRDV